MEPINLEKGGSVNLTKESESELKKVVIGAGWDPAQEGNTMDLDLSLYQLNADNKCPSPGCLIFFNNKGNEGDAVYHTGDNLTGEGDGDDEQIIVDLEKLDNAITSLDIILNIYQAQSKGQNLSQLKNAFCRMVNKESGQDIFHFDVHEGMSGDTVHLGRLNRTPEGWVFVADGKTSEMGLSGLNQQYGL